MKPKQHCIKCNTLIKSYPFKNENSVVIGHIIYCPKCFGCRVKR